jgi:hypothetical protein
VSEVSLLLDVERLRRLLGDLVTCYRFTNRLDEALLLVPGELWAEVCEHALRERPDGGLDPDGGAAAVGSTAGEAHR